jgi:hypothetical protein
MSLPVCSKLLLTRRDARFVKFTTLPQYSQAARVKLT